MSTTPTPRERDDAIRNAFTKHLEARRKDQAFMARLEASIKRNKHILDRLADADSQPPGAASKTVEP